MNPSLLSVLACIATGFVCLAIGYRIGANDGRARGWLERYYQEIDAQARRAERFVALHPRQGGQFAPRVNGNGRN